MQPIVFTVDEINKQTIDFQKEYFHFEPFLKDQTCPTFKYYAFKELMFDFLNEKNVEENIQISFEGEGDSGQIYHVSIPSEIKSESFYGIAFRDFIEELGDEILKMTQHDWYNNEGGYGEIFIDPSQKTIRLDINIRYTEVNNYAESY